MRCVIYCRVSSAKQREAHTIDNQREVLLAYAQNQGWRVFSIEEDDGLSGDLSPWERPAMLRVLKMVERRSFDMLITTDLDRLSRDDDMVDFPVIRKELRDHGIRLATPKGEMDLNNADDVFNQNLRASFASWERQKIKERTVDARRRSIRRGGRPIPPPPLGWCWNEATSAFVKDDVEAPIVREAFRLLAVEGLSKNATVWRLKEDGFSSRLQKKTGERKFLVSRTLDRMIRRSTYHTGQWVPQPKDLPDVVVPMPPLIDEATWTAANLALDRRRTFPTRRSEYGFLLRGLVVCAGCGRKMRSQRDRQPGGEYAYYRCQYADHIHLNQTRCDNRRGIRADDVDKQVWDYVARLVSDPEALRGEVERMMANELGPQEDLDAELRKVKAKLSTMDEQDAAIRRMYRKGKLTEGQCDADREEVEAERAPLVQRRNLLLMQKRTGVERTARIAAVEERLLGMVGVVDDLDQEQRIKLVQAVVQSVVISVASGKVTVNLLFDTSLPDEDDMGGGYGADGPGGRPERWQDGGSGASRFYGGGQRASMKPKANGHAGDPIL